MKQYWQSQIYFSFPRIRPAPRSPSRTTTSLPTPLVQMMLALRLCFVDAGFVLSTRESPAFRDADGRICVTRVGRLPHQPRRLFRPRRRHRAVRRCDARSPAEVAAMIRTAGREPVWKDWDAAFTAPATPTPADV